MIEQPGISARGTVFAARLRAVVARAEPALRAIADVASTQPRAASAWSPHEIVGPQIDSARSSHPLGVAFAVVERSLARVEVGA